MMIYFSQQSSYILDCYERKTKPKLFTIITELCKKERQNHNSYILIAIQSSHSMFLNDDIFFKNLLGLQSAGEDKTKIVIFSQKTQRFDILKEQWKISFFIFKNLLVLHFPYESACCDNTGLDDLFVFSINHHRFVQIH